MPKRHPDAPLSEWFWTRVSVAGPSDCWLWMGHVEQGGYGSLSIGPRGRNTRTKAHRLAWELANKKPVPDGLFVCHSCDVPRCCNPSHLFVGTSDDNIADMIAKKRHGIGTRNGRCKLSEAQVLAIRADGRSSRAVAADYGLSKTHVLFIRRNQSWAHVH